MLLAFKGDYVMVFVRQNETDNTKERVNKDLKKYIEENVFPEYTKNEKAHGIDHIEYVINRSFKFADSIPGIDYNIVYAVAAYHDIGHHLDPKKHEIISARIASEDKNLKKIFSQEELKIIKEAIEDHRASSSTKPRSIYGRIVSTADRNISIEDCLRRSYVYCKDHEPSLTDEEIFVRAYEHIKMKFGENGYAKFFFKDLEYENFLKEIRELLRDKENFIRIQKNYIECLKSSGVI